MTYGGIGPAADLYKASYETYEAYGYALVAVSLLWSLFNLAVNTSFVVEGLATNKKGFFSKKHGGRLRTLMFVLSVAQVRELSWAP